MKQNQSDNQTLELLQTLAAKLDALENAIKSHTPKDLLTSKEAAKYLNVKMNWLDKLCSQGRITYTQPGGKARFFKKSDLDNYLKKNVRKSDAEIDDEAAELFQKQSHRLIQNRRL